MIEEHLVTSEDTMAKETALEQVRKLQEQLHKLSESAKDEALSQATEAVETLNSLGYHFVLTEEGKAKPKKQRTKSTGVCPICDFATEPAHDGRRHKGRERRPFTKDELLELGLARI